VDARQARLVTPRVADTSRGLRGVAHERDRLPLGEDGGERRAPGTGAEDGHPRRRTGEPRGRARPLGATHQLRRLRATRRLAVRFSRICSRNTSRIGVPSKLYASRSRFSRYRRYEKWIDVGSVAKNTTVGGATPAWVAYRIFARRPRTIAGGVRSI